MASAKKKFTERIGNWFRGMRSELKKVVWPTKKQVINNSLVVLAVVVVCGVAVWVLDYAASAIVQMLLKLFG